MSVTQFSNREAINEQSTARYSCVFVDHLKQPIDSSAVQTITATLKDVFDDAVINGRNAQNVKGVAGGTLDVGGAFSLVLSKEDTIARGTHSTMQERRLTLIVTFTDGQLTHEVDFFIRDLKDVT